jgi:hypothetical protein
MSYTKEPIDFTMRPQEKVVESFTKKKLPDTAFTWWTAQNDKDLLSQGLSTTEYLKRTNATRIRQASIYTRLDCGKPLYNFMASNATLDSSNQMPIGRPTANVVHANTETFVSLLTQDKPKPIFLTDNGNYKERLLAKEANAFIQGELFRTEAYDKVRIMIKDGGVIGDGFLKVYPKHNKVHIDRVLQTELLVDFLDGYYGHPRQLAHLKMIPRSVAYEEFPKGAQYIAQAQAGMVDSTPKSVETISDNIIVSEMWHLPSAPDAKDGRHIILCNEGVLLDETWERQRYPFVKWGYNPNMVTWWSQGLAEILMPIQMEIYRSLIVASQSLELMAVPRIYIDELAEIMETAFNNRIGTIIKGRGGQPPQILNWQANNQEMYSWIQWLITLSSDMSGVSEMSSQAKKSPGLNSGEAIREANDLQSARFATQESRYQKIFVDLSYQIIDCASDIVDETGKYMTVYPSKDGTREVDFKHIKKLKDTYIIQCFDESSLPKDPAGRQAKLSEMLAAGEITMQEFRRLANFSDLEQSDKLATALQERIFYCLDDIIENGDKNWDEIAPDNFILDPTDMASTYCVNYINLYAPTNLEEEKRQLLRDWFTQVKDLKDQIAQQAAAQAQAAQMQAQAQAQSQPPPQQQQLQVAPPNQSLGPTSNAQV